jgi:hypothetical protein
MNTTSTSSSSISVPINARDRRRDASLGHILLVFPKLGTVHQVGKGGFVRHPTVSLVVMVAAEIGSKDADFLAGAGIALVGVSAEETSYCQPTIWPWWRAQEVCSAVALLEDRRGDGGRFSFSAKADDADDGEHDP